MPRKMAGISDVTHLIYRTCCYCCLCLGEKLHFWKGGHVCFTNLAMQFGVHVFEHSAFLHGQEKNEDNCTLKRYPVFLLSHIMIIISSIPFLICYRFLSCYSFEDRLFQVEYLALFQGELNIRVTWNRVE